VGCRGSNCVKFWCWRGFTRVSCSSRSIDFRLFVSEPAWLFTAVSLPTNVIASRTGETLRGGSIASTDGTGLRLGFVLAKASKGEMESKNDLLERAAVAGKENGGAGSGPSKLASCSLCIGGGTLVASLAFFSCELRGNMLASLATEDGVFESGDNGKFATRLKNNWNVRT
jgi:hypothetical protein